MTRIDADHKDRAGIERGLSFCLSNSRAPNVVGMSWNDPET